MEGGAGRGGGQVDDDTGLPTKLVGYDAREEVSRQGGKPAAISKLRHMYPYETIAMVGDGITDLEAVQISGGADLFIGFAPFPLSPLQIARCWPGGAGTGGFQAPSRYWRGVVAGCLPRSLAERGVKSTEESMGGPGSGESSCE